MSDIEVIYFGCKSAVNRGHFIYRKPDGGGYARSDYRHPLMGKIDGKYANSTRPAGAATLVWVDGYTIVAFNDYSADTRPGSNSAFLAEGRHDADLILSLARKQWPEMWDRFNFEVEMVETRDLEKR